MVLSHQLLASNELTVATIVKPADMIDRFLQEVRRASEQAKQQDAPLLLLIFCHGHTSLELLLNDGDHKNGLSVVRLKGVLELGVRVTLITTACYSGGWVTIPDLNSTAIVAAAEGDLSNAWPTSDTMGRACGSVFASTLIDTLCSASSPLVANADGRPSIPALELEAKLQDSPLQPRDPDEQQTQTYNAFCHSILETCQGIYRLWSQQSFSFSAQDDMWEYSWTGRTGIPLAHFEQRWNNLPTVPYTGPAELKAQRDPDPSNPNFKTTGFFSRVGGIKDLTDKMTASIHQKRVAEMAQIMLQTCPGDWSAGFNVSVGACLRYYAKGIIDDEEHGWDERGWVVEEMIRFRWEMCLLADYVVNLLDLPMPGNEICISWNRMFWRSSMKEKIPDWDERLSKVWVILRDGGFIIPSTRQQGPEFTRPITYVATALVEAGKSEEETIASAQRALAFIAAAKKFEQNRACKDLGVRSRGRDWLKSVGRSIRRSLSPSKRIGRDGLSTISRSDSSSRRTGLLPGQVPKVGPLNSRS